MTEMRFYHLERRCLGWVAVLAAVLCASGAQARSYDCAAPLDGSTWAPTPAQVDQLLDDWSANSGLRADDYVPRFCGVTESGRRVIMIGALHIVGDFALCDDPANFAVFYDPGTRRFSGRIPKQTF